MPNPLYWRGQPKLQKIIYKIIPDRNTVLVAAPSSRNRYVASSPRQLSFRACKRFPGILDSCASPAIFTIISTSTSQRPAVARPRRPRGDELGHRPADTHREDRPRRRHPSRCHDAEERALCRQPRSRRCRSTSRAPMRFSTRTAGRAVADGIRREKRLTAFARVCDRPRDRPTSTSRSS